MKQSLLLICTIILLQGCKLKDDPMSQTGIVVFQLSGSIDSTTWLKQAGVGMWYQYTGIETGNLGVTQLTGTLKRNCVSCKESMKVFFRGDQLGQALNLDTVLAIGDHAFMNLADTTIVTGFKVQFNGAVNGLTPANFAWTFSDGFKASSQVLNRTFTTPQKLDVTYVVKYADNCQAELTSPVYVNQLMAKTKLTFTTTFSTNRLVYFIPSVTDTSGAKYYWDFGDQKIANDMTVSHLYPDSGSYKVCLRYAKAPDTLVTCQLIRTPDKKTCGANFSYSVDPILNQLLLNTVGVIYTDSLGNEFHSETMPQSSGSYFRVVAVQPYQKNENGQSTKMLQVEFNCGVQGSNRIKKLNNFKGKIAVAVP